MSTDSFGLGEVSHGQQDHHRGGQEGHETPEQGDLEVDTVIAPGGLHPAIVDQQDQQTIQDHHERDTPLRHRPERHYSPPRR